MEPLFNTKQIIDLENLWVSNKQGTLSDLMERAGRAAFDFIERQYGNHPLNVLVLCGQGNNGGDGYVLARWLVKAGHKVTLCYSRPPCQQAQPAYWAYQQWLNVSSQSHYTGLTECEVSDLNQFELIVDALFGIGLNRDIAGDVGPLIEKINEATPPVLSLDIPSGVCADSGRIYQHAIAATHTLTFLGRKVGLFTGQAKTFCGQIICCDLNLGHDVDKVLNTSSYLIAQEDLVFKAPALDIHKGRNGKLLCVGGLVAMSGAIDLTSRAALRTGAGLVCVHTHKESRGELAHAYPERMVSSDEQILVTQRFSWADVLACGPGLGRTEWGEQLYLKCAAVNKPKVVDADGLYWLARYPQKDAQRIITPHSGEAARLLNCTVAEVEKDRVKATRRLQEIYCGVVVLKGPGTLIYDGQRSYFCQAGNPGMATGGMGDVLTGVIAALLGQGETLFDAAWRGVLLHSCAADSEALEHGMVGMCAHDLMPHIRRLRNHYFS
ncbi:MULTISPECIES: NAD(P)H-hydrate dehydratase [unclassified Vibrio]|uniref:Bifunctional NAD(P)H-hydrate repair enzyme n=1 Tax=Vibrio sp. HB236076 TaxID=3232307 RepID=A0AB39HL04_9VIBR|nr:NAD(P)H-hydrate dehydratase [Vibrio sp. HB161653]MDP5253236.1 NAD(P)H-hydrate dehydratase [Vibrio sp. HB161653]